MRIGLLTWRIVAICWLLVLGASAEGLLAAAPGRLLVRVDQPSTPISGTLYGLMTEEINHGYDGGLYAELIRNRNFAEPSALPVGENRDVSKAGLAHWSLVSAANARGSIAIDHNDPVNTIACRNSLKLHVASVPAGGRVGFANEGYWGIPAWPHTQYRASFYAKAAPGFNGPINVSIESNDGRIVQASATLPAVTQEWRKYTLTLRTGEIPLSVDNRFVISTPSPGSVWFSFVSLFPPTYKNRENGLRADLMELMAQMKPAFLRFPGGNYLEGNEVHERFNWKETIGPVEERPGHMCPWGYRSTDGLGMMEFLLWCEDLNMEPLLDVYAGYSLRGAYIPAGPALEPYVQEALDQIEYVIGDTTTRWGARRARDGHPAPFKLTYVEVGNEDWFDRSGSYDGRFAQYYDAIRAKYPQLKIIASSAVTSRVPDVLDDHFYRSSVAMQRDVSHYNNHDRNSYKIFVGEWATTEGSPTPTMNAALGDAAWMTGMERNSDVVILSAYAPLLVNVNPGASQWGTNLIGFNALSSFGSTSYYAQRLFAQNRGDTLIPVEITSKAVPAPEPPMPKGGVGVASWATQVEYADLKVTRPDGSVLWQPDFSRQLEDWQTANGAWQVQGNVLRQTSDATNCRAIAGDPSWTDYDFTLRARKTGGNEGFMVMFHAQDTENFIWWNIGGWTNTRTALEKSERGSKAQVGPESDLTVDTGRWYDLKVEVRGRNIKCYADGRLITEAADVPTPPVDPVYATASRMDVSGEIILKVVNAGPIVQPLEVTLQGVRNVEPTASGEILAGEPGAVNSLAQPTRIAPKPLNLTNVSPRFVHEFPAHSISVIRLKPR